MARQQAIFQNEKSIAAAALVGLGLAILFGKVCGPTAQVTNILGFVAREAMQLMPLSSPRPGELCKAMASITRGFLHAFSRCWYPAGR